MSIKQVFNTSADLDYPNVLPTLDLDFANTKTLDPRITFTRSSGGSYFGPDGILRYAGVNEARFDHNPTTGESLGLLVEEQRTNSLANNTAQGAVAGAPGTVPTGWAVTTDVNGISREIVGIGTEDGINYIDIKYSGTTTASGQLSILPTTITTITASNGQSWTASAYVKLRAGSLSGLSNTLLSVNGRSSIGASLESTNTTFTPSNAALRLQRQTASITLANASTARISMTAFAANYASGATIDITLRIGLPQLEQGAFATSVIPTTGTAATRSADVTSITGTEFSSWYRQDEGTILYDGTVSQGVAALPWFYNISNGTVNNSIGVYQFTNGIYGSTVAGGVAATPDPAVLFSPTAGSSAKHALAIKASDSRAALNGTLSSVQTNTVMPVVNALSIGQRVSGNRMTGTIRRLTYWPKRLPNAQLQALTR